MRAARAIIFVLFVLFVVKPPPGAAITARSKPIGRNRSASNL
jgi:hypothetical protein